MRSTLKMKTFRFFNEVKEALSTNLAHVEAKQILDKKQRQTFFSKKR